MVLRGTWSDVSERFSLPFLPHSSALLKPDGCLLSRSVLVATLSLFGGRTTLLPTPSVTRSGTAEVPPGGLRPGASAKLTATWSSRSGVDPRAPAMVTEMRSAHRTAGGAAGGNGATASAWRPAVGAGSESPHSPRRRNPPACRRALVRSGPPAGAGARGAVHQLAAAPARRAAPQRRCSLSAQVAWPPPAE
jgi:hypothetical protein